MRIHSSAAHRDSDVDASFLAAVQVEADTTMVEDSRRGSRFVIPFVLPTLYMMWVVVGEPARTRAVHIAFAACVAAVVLRLAIMYAAVKPLPGVGLSKRSHFMVTASSWSMATGLAGIYLSLGASVNAVQWLTLALMSTAVCAVGLLTATASVLRFTGTVAIQMTALAYSLYRTGDPALDLVASFGLIFVLVLTLIARKNAAAVREKTLLTLRMRDMGLRDALTGLRNRAFAEELLNHRSTQVVEQWTEPGRRQLSASSCRRLALVLIDIDHFKKVNDTHGHDGGDEVLVSFAKTAQSVLRSGDVVARWGGEEFMLILEVDDMVAAHAVAERLREAVAATPVVLSSGQSLAVTCSIGATPFPIDLRRPDAETWRETLKRADSSLYRAKALGRNRTAWAAPVTDPDDLEADEAPTLRFRRPAQHAA